MKKQLQHTFLAIVLGFTALPARTQVSFFKPPVDQEFGIHKGFNGYPHPLDIRFFDADGDGDNDLTFWGTDDTVSFSFEAGDTCFLWFQENTGSPEDPQFGMPVAVPALILDSTYQQFPFFHRQSLNLVDFDQDGDLDVCGLYQSGFWPSDTASIYFRENLSGQLSVFTLAQPIIRDFPPGAFHLSGEEEAVIRPVDYNRDGHMDLLIWAYAGEDSGPPSTLAFWWMPNNGSGDALPFDTLLFNPPALSAIAAQYQPGEIVGPWDSLIYNFDILDVNGDGALDIWVYHDWGVHWYKGLSDDSLHFQAAPAFRFLWPEIDPLPAPLEYAAFQAPALADLDGDGDADAILSGWIMEWQGIFLPGIYRGWFSFYFENLLVTPNYVFGKAFIDVNGDSTFTAGDAPVVGRSVVAHPSGVVAVTDAEGDYAMYVPDGEQTVAMDPPSAWKTIPDSYTINATGGPQSSQADFAWQFNGTGRDLRVEAVPAFVRPGFETTYRIRLTNDGSQVESGVLSVTLDGTLTFVSAVPPATAVSGNQVSWNFPGLLPLETREARLTALVAPATPQGDTVRSLFQVAPLDGDLAPENNAVLLEQIITGSYDPNDKLVQPLGSGPEGFVPESIELFTYTIRFQNTGTDTAFRVVITDTLDADLDATTFEMTAWSHAYTLTVDSQRVARWVFDGILLPDSTTDPAGSQGFVQYGVRPNDSKPPGTRFTNRAHIYFDFNEPIATNTTVNTIAVPLGIPNMQSLEFRLYPNPAHETARLEFGNPAGARAVLEVFSLAGHRLAYRETHGNAFEWKRGELPAGTYLFRLRVGDRTGAGKLIVAGW